MAADKCPPCTTALQLVTSCTGCSICLVQSVQLAFGLRFCDESQGIRSVQLPNVNSLAPVTAAAAILSFCFSTISISATIAEDGHSAVSHDLHGRSVPDSVSGIMRGMGYALKTLGYCVSQHVSLGLENAALLDDAPGHTQRLA